jgi:hypothetical protein
LLIVSLLYLQAWSVAAEREIANKPRTAEVLKGTVVHVFENFVTDNASLQRVAKVRLINASRDKDNLVIVDIPKNILLVQGDRVLINKVENSETFDMGDTFDNTYVFKDFARDHAVILVLSSFCLLLFFINRASFYAALLIGANLVLIGVLLPAMLSLNHGSIPWVFLGLFLAANGGLLWQVLPSKKFVLALSVSSVATVLIMVVYSFFASWAHLQEYVFLQKMLPGTLAQGLIEVDSLALAIANFFIAFYVVLFVIRVSYVHTIYDNVKIAALRLAYIYFLLGIGLALPVFIYGLANELGPETIFNYMPFVLTIVKISFLFWGTLVSTILYLLFFYINNKHYFQKHIIIPAEGKKQQVDVQRIITDQRVQIYNAQQRPTKKRKKRTRS